jgi:hypothetical protein
MLADRSRTKYGGDPSVDMIGLQTRQSQDQQHYYQYAHRYGAIATPW